MRYQVCLLLAALLLLPVQGLAFEEAQPPAVEDGAAPEVGVAAQPAEEVGGDEGYWDESEEAAPAETPEALTPVELPGRPAAPEEEPGDIHEDDVTTLPEGLSPEGDL